MRKTSYDTVVAERDRLASQVGRLTEQLARANGEINSLKFRYNDVSFRYEQMLKAGEKKTTAPVAEFINQANPVPPKGRNEPPAVKGINRSTSRTIRENDFSVDVADLVAGAAVAATISTIASSSYSGGSSSSSCWVDSGSSNYDSGGDSSPAASCD